MYSLFDLSNLLEAILLADKIVTLPSEDNTENETMKTLKREKILYELEIKKDIAQVVSHLKYTWDPDSIISEFKQLC
jgi:Zn-dependent membrane protease YugP